jgi:hypothetical protein
VSSAVICEKLRSGVETTCKRNEILVEKGKNGKRQNVRDDSPHKIKREIHFLRSLQRRDGILKSWRTMVVHFVMLKLRVKRGCPKFLAGVPLNGFKKITCTEQ